MKSNGIRKTLAILLSFALAMPLFVFATFADDTVFTQMTVYTDSLEPGGTWYNRRQLASDMDNSNYKYATIYLSEDSNTLKIEYTVNDETVTELHTRAEEPAFFTYFCILPEFGDPLPTSPDGLDDGAYWFDLEGLLELARTYGFAEENMYIFSDATYRLSVDGKILRKSVAYAGTSYIMKQDEFLDDPEIMSGFLHQVGVDPNAGFILLPTSDEGLEDGEYWFDLESFTQAMGEENQQVYSTAKFYLSEDGNTLRIEVAGQKLDLNSADEYTSTYFSFVRQVGVDPNVIPGFILLPTSDEGLEDGDYWFDSAGFAAMVSSEDYLTYLYYLSEDGNTLRIKMGTYMYSVARTDEYSGTYFSYLHQVGVDPNAGYSVLPYSPEGLEDGDYWFDLPALAEAEGMDEAEIEEFTASTSFLISDDGSTVRMIQQGYMFDIPVDSSEYQDILMFLRRVGEDPNAGFTLLPTSEEGLRFGEFWYDAAGLAAADQAEELATASYYLSSDGSTIRVLVSGMTIDVAADNEDMGAMVFGFLHQIGEDTTKAYLTMNVPDEPVYTGDTVQVTVDLEQNPGLAAMALSLSYDTDVLTLTDVQASGMMTAGNLTPGGDLNVQPYKILWDDGTALENHNETGTVLTLTFTVKDDAEAGTTVIALNYDADSTFNVDLQDVPLSISAVTITVVKHTPGDADGDGEVDLMDVAVLTRFLAEGWDETVDERNSDVNGDGVLDLKDVVLIRRFLAGGWGVELV